LLDCLRRGVVLDPEDANHVAPCPRLGVGVAAQLLFSPIHKILLPPNIGIRYIEQRLGKIRLGFYQSEQEQSVVVATFSARP
jgi:hypothetical protein